MIDKRKTSTSAVSQDSATKSATSKSVHETVLSADVEGSNYDKPIHISQNKNQAYGSLSGGASNVSECLNSPDHPPLSDGYETISATPVVQERMPKSAQKTVLGAGVKDGDYDKSILISQNGNGSLPDSVLNINHQNSSRAANSPPLNDGYSTISEVLDSPANGEEVGPLYSEVGTKGASTDKDTRKADNDAKNGGSEMPVYSEVKKKSQTETSGYSTLSDEALLHSADNADEIGVERSTSFPPPPPPHTSEMNELQDPANRKEGRGLESESTPGNTPTGPGDISAGPDLGNVTSQEAAIEQEEN